LKKIVLLLVAIVIALPILASCQNIDDINTATPVDSTNTVDITPVLDPKLGVKICEDFWRDFSEGLGLETRGRKLEDIRITQYLGNYGGYEVLCMTIAGEIYPAVLPRIEVAGYTIQFKSGHHLCVYKDSRFHGISAVYDSGFITKADIYNIGIIGGYNFIERYPEPPR
jgi:hypothetical protein